MRCTASADMGTNSSLRRRQGNKIIPVPPQSADEGRSCADICCIRRVINTTRARPGGAAESGMRENYAKRTIYCDLVDSEDTAAGCQSNTEGEGGGGAVALGGQQIEGHCFPNQSTKSSCVC